MNMKKILLIALLVVSLTGIKAQTTIECTVDTFYFFIMKNDTVVLEPTMVTPGMAVTSNYQAVGAELYMSDELQNCIDKIQNDSLKESDHSIALLYVIEKNLYAYVKED